MRVEAVERVFHRQQVIERGRRRVDVGRLLHVAEIADVVGGDEADRAADIALVGQADEPGVLAEALGQAEVGELQLAGRAVGPITSRFEGFTSRWT